MDDLTPFEVEALSKVMGSTVLNEYKQKEAISEVSLADPKQSFSTSPNEKQTISASHAQFIQLDEGLESPSSNSSLNDEILQGIKLNVEVVLGTTKMPLRDVLKLQSGSVVTLNVLAGEPVHLLINGKLVAEAEVVVVDDNFAVRILEIFPTKD